MAKLLSTPEVAQRLGISERHVRWLIEEKRLAARKVGRNFVIEERALAKADLPGRGSPGRARNRSKKDAETP